MFLMEEKWINNYLMASIYSKLKKMDEWLRNRLKHCIWHDWMNDCSRHCRECCQRQYMERTESRPFGRAAERKRKNLIKLGVMRWMAYAWSRTRMGGWVVSQSPILGTTITVSRLRRKGYESMDDYYSKFKTSIW